MSNLEDCRSVVCRSTWVVVFPHEYIPVMHMWQELHRNDVSSSVCHIKRFLLSIWPIVGDTHFDYLSGVFARFLYYKVKSQRFIYINFYVYIYIMLYIMFMLYYVYKDFFFSWTSNLVMVLLRHCVIILFIRLYLMALIAIDNPCLNQLRKSWLQTGNFLALVFLLY